MEDGRIIEEHDPQSFDSTCKIILWGLTLNGFLGACGRFNSLEVSKIHFDSI